MSRRYSIIIQLWRHVVENGNSFVVFANGTVVIFNREITGRDVDLRREAISRLKSLDVQEVAVAELVGQGRGWIVNCGSDYILAYLPHCKYESRYEAIRSSVDLQKAEQARLKVIHVEDRR